MMATIALALAACSTLDSTPEPQAKEQLLWPALPDQPRFRYQGMLRSAADLQPQSGKSAFDKLKDITTTPSEANRDPVIYKPSGIAVRNGLVYVTEPVVRAVTVFDIPRRKLFRFGTREPNTLKNPQAIALDGSGQIYVLDSGRNQVMVFDAYGLFQRSIALGDRFSKPVSIAVSPQGKTVYVVDRGTVEDNEHKVVALDLDGKELLRLGPRGSKDGEFNMPVAAAVARDGTLYVVDAGNFRVQAFDASGKMKLKFGRPGAGLGNFSRPRAIAIDAEDNIYITDGAYNNVQIFNAQGELLMPLGRLSQLPGPGRFALIAGLAVDEANRLLVLDHYFRKIEVYGRIPEEEGRRLMGAS